MKEGQNRIFGRVYFWIDLQQFCNVVKWRLSDMHKKINDAIQNVCHVAWLVPDHSHNFFTGDSKPRLDMPRVPTRVRYDPG